MHSRLTVPALLVALTVPLAFGCGGEDNGDGGEPTATSIGGTPVGNGTIVVPTLPADPGEPTPRNLDEAVERLSEQIDAIGANIGAVPDDIRDQLVERCLTIGAFADEDDVEAICQQIEVAIDTNDPGLIDSVLSQLTALEES
jgi:hypothetical protein